MSYFWTGFDCDSVPSCPAGLQVPLSGWWPQEKAWRVSHTQTFRLSVCLPGVQLIPRHLLGRRSHRQLHSSVELNGKTFFQWDKVTSLLTFTLLFYTYFYCYQR